MTICIKNYFDIGHRSISRSREQNHLGMTWLTSASLHSISSRSIASPAIRYFRLASKDVARLHRTASCRCGRVPAVTSPAAEPVPVVRSGAELWAGLRLVWATSGHAEAQPGGGRRPRGRRSGRPLNAPRCPARRWQPTVSRRITLWATLPSPSAPFVQVRASTGAHRRPRALQRPRRRLQSPGRPSDGSPSDVHSIFNCMNGIYVIIFIVMRNFLEWSSKIL